MTEPPVRDPVVTLTAPARQLTAGDDFARMDTALIDATVAALAQRGWRVKEAVNLREMEHRFAGADASRAAGLNAALSDPDTDLILALRGGYGTARLLPLADGFDWPDIQGALTKLDEEVGELHQAVREGANVAEELGDVLFAAVKAARFAGVDPEDALNAACEKFIRRYAAVEQGAAGRGVPRCSSCPPRCCGESLRIW